MSLPRLQMHDTHAGMYDCTDELHALPKQCPQKVARAFLQRMPAARLWMTTVLHMGGAHMYQSEALPVCALQPVAVRSSIDVFGENKRLVVEIDSEAFGSVVYVIIAAVQVGSITMTTKEGQRVSKVGKPRWPWCVERCLHDDAAASYN